MFPAERPRRLRRTAALRRLVAETTIAPSDLVWPMFVAEGLSEPRPVASLPGVTQDPVSLVADRVRAARDLGIPAVILFGLPAQKDSEGSQAWHPEGVIQRALRAAAAVSDGEVAVMADLCLDEYTDHGHCGVLTSKGEVDNDATIELYARVAVAQAEAGVDVVAPSGMMDGQVSAIRSALDAAGFPDVAILAYAAKYASALYGPFRDAVNVEIVGGGDRRGYQQDPRNRRESLREVRLDIAEGADMVMVKPALSYLDVIADVRRSVDVPVAAYHVSGEYAMVRAAAERGWIDGAAVMYEHVLAMKRAGADVILTYAAPDIAAACS